MVKTKNDELRKLILREIGSHPGIKISEIAKNSGITFQVVNKILKEGWMSNFVKSTENKKEKSNIRECRKSRFFEVIQPHIKFRYNSA